MVGVIAPLKSVRRKFPLSQILAVLTVTILSLVSGLQFAWTSPFISVLISDKSPIPMSFEEASYLTIIPPITSIIAGPLFAKLLNKIGRKVTLLLTGALQLVSCIMMAFSNSLILLYVARAISGIGDGGMYTIVPIYVGEVLEPRIRGTLGSFVSFAIYFGQFLINVIGTYVSMQKTAFIAAVFPFLFLVTFLFMPESPYYLIMKNRAEDARGSLRKLREVHDVEGEMEKLEIDVRRQLSEPNSVKDLFVIGSNRSALFIAVGLRIAHQMSGITAFSVYTQYLFEKACGDISQSVSAMAYSGLQCIAVCFAPLIVDRFGRRPLMFASSFGCGVLLSVETVYFYLSEHTNVDLSLFTWIPLAGMLLYIIAFCVGFGIVPTLMLSELFSASIKGEALCFMTMFYCFCILVTSKVFQVMASNLGLFAPFCMFAVCCFASTFFSYWCIPETKGKTLEEIQQCLKNRKIR